jgi:multiple sugar transport system permease protein
MADITAEIAPADSLTHIGAREQARPTVSRGIARKYVLSAVMVVLAVIWLLPALWVLVTSLKQSQDIVKVPPVWIPWPMTIAHYGEALFSVRTASVGRAFLNSTLVSVVTVVAVMAISALAAYPLARMRFKGRDTIFALLVGSMMVPSIIAIVPLYVLMQQLGWLSTYQALVLPDAAATIAFGVFLLRQFFRGLPLELEEAARIDGANTWQIFSRVLLPLTKPALAALAIFAFRSSWNDFTWPLIAINKPDMLTLPLALTLLRSAYSNESYGAITAGAVLSALPLLIVFILANRHIIEGVQFSGMKN